MTQTIEFVALTEQRVSFDNQEAFHFRNDRPAKWLQKVCFFVLKKLRAFYVDETVKIERHLINDRTFMERLFKQRENLNRFHYKRPTTLLIGAEDYAKLMHETATTRMFQFAAEYGYNGKILGMTVHVIPWMRGCLVLPDNVL